MSDTAPLSWAERVSQEVEKLSDGKVSATLVMALLESAGEMKTVQLKSLLGRCLEVINTSKENDAAACTVDGLTDEILEAIK